MSFTHSPDVFRAAKLVSAQAGCRVDDALALIHERADEARVSIDEIAADVLDQSVRFDV